MKGMPTSHLRTRNFSLAGCCFSLICVLSLLVSACGSSSTPASSPTATVAATATKGSGTVQVMYAASLESTMENKVKAAFAQSTGYTFEGEAKGSLALANEIKGHLHRPGYFYQRFPWRQYPVDGGGER